jgi:hypothetical protein
MTVPVHDCAGHIHDDAKDAFLATLRGISSSAMIEL